MTSAAPDRLSRSAVRALIRSLAAADYLRLFSIAKAYAWIVDRDPGDLLHTAIVRALDRRTCRPGVSAVGFVAGIMRSLVSDQLRLAETRLNLSGLWHDLEEPGRLAARCEDQEDSVHRRIDGDTLRARLDAVLATDPGLARFVEAICDGVLGQELAERLDIGSRDIATLRKRLSRRIDAVRPTDDTVRLNEKAGS